jgi:hypothetical protein
MDVCPGCGIEINMKDLTPPEKTSGGLKDCQWIEDPETRKRINDSLTALRRKQGGTVYD